MTTKQQDRRPYGHVIAHQYTWMEHATHQAKVAKGDVAPLYGVEFVQATGRNRHERRRAALRDFAWRALVSRRDLARAKATDRSRVAFP